jgi:hypothetical protein
LSCANAGVTLAASSSAKIAFLIDISLPLDVRAGFQYPILLINMLSSLPDFSSRTSGAGVRKINRAIFLRCSAMAHVVWFPCPLRNLLYDIIIIASPPQALPSGAALQSKPTQRSKHCGQK